MKLSLKTKAGIGASVVAVAALASTFAFADVAPTITTVINNSSNTQVVSAPIGTNVYAIAAVGQGSGTSTPQGSVDFKIFTNTSCSGTPATQAGVALVNGVATSSTSVVPASGLSYQVHYNGQAGTYTVLDGDCKSVNAQATSTSIAVGLSTTTVYTGASVFASSTLNGLAANATGTVAYKVYTNNSCTTGTINAGTASVSNGTVSNSNTLQFNSAGTYYWQAVYGGDQFNAIATSSCQGAVLTVLATSTPSTPGSGRISGTVYNDLDRDMTRDAGEGALSGWTIKLYQGTGWSTGGKAAYKTAVSDSNGAYSFTNLPDGTYSIEEIGKNGWIQVSSDFDSVVITNGAQLSGYNFGDAAKTSSNDNGHEKPGKGHDKDKHEKVEKKGNNGNHYGWFKNLFNHGKNKNK